MQFKNPNDTSWNLIIDVNAKPFIKNMYELKQNRFANEIEEEINIFYTFSNLQFKLYIEALNAKAFIANI